MNNLNRYLLTACLLASTLFSAQATDILEKTDYRLVNAYTKAGNLCLQDNRNGLNATDFIFSYAERDTTDDTQVWQFIKDANDPSLYYLRNKATRRFLSAELESRGNLFKLRSQNTKTNAKPWTVTEITNGQLLFSCVNEYGVRYYIHATDTTTLTTNYPKFLTNPIGNRNTRFAWILEPVDATPDAIQSVLQQNHEVKVSVLDRHIVVANDEDYRIYDAHGAQLDKEQALQPGIYIVFTRQQTFKVIVK